MQQVILQPPQKIQSGIWSQFQQFAYLIQYACQVYPRVSTPGQKNNVSAEMLQDRRFALLCGWIDESIILEKDDLGLSGQLRMEEREAFVKMLRNIANGTIKAIVVANISRFFRRKWNDEAEKFMQICDTYGVVVIVPNAQRTAIKAIYDFSQSADIQAFRRECEEAWKYLENHIYGTMLAAQDVLGQIGRWGGWNLPPGYIVDRREKIEGELNPDYRLYIPYPPHAKVVNWLHDRFWQLNFNRAALRREISRLEYLFPAFEEWVDKEFYNKLPMTKVLDERGNIKGYTITSDHGLISVLSNRMSIGYAEWRGEIVSSENHIPIVDYNKFAVSYNHISPVRLDGTPNEWIVGRKLAYAKKHTTEYIVVLDGKLRAKDPALRVNTCPRLVEKKDEPLSTLTYYAFYQRGRQSREAARYRILATDLDRIFLDHFIMRLQQADDFNDFLSAEAAEKAQQVQLINDLDVQIDAARKAMQQKKEYLDSGKIKNLDLLTELDVSYTSLQEDLARMERQRDKISSSKTTVQQRRSYKQMMQEAGECWEEVVTPEELPLMIDAFVEKVVLEPLAPHFYLMAIHWSDPEWGVDELLCYRNCNPSIQWTEEEKTILKNHYATATQEELMHLLPNRSFDLMRVYGSKFKIRRKLQPMSPGLPVTYCLRDYEIMQQFGLTEDFLRNLKRGSFITCSSPQVLRCSRQNR